MVSDSPCFLWLGKQPALDFINTELMNRGERTDLLIDIDSLVRWLVEAGLLPSTAGADALGRWRGSREAPKLLEQARRLRTAIRTITERLVQGKGMSRPAIDLINSVLRLTAGHPQLARTSAGFERRIEFHLQQPTQLLQPVASAAADLFCDAEPELIKRCDNQACILYFYDVSRNHGRRWCSMELCGNRTKVAAHHERQRSDG